MLNSMVRWVFKTCTRPWTVFLISQVFNGADSNSPRFARSRGTFDDVEDPLGGWEKYGSTTRPEALRIYFHPVTLAVLLARISAVRRHCHGR